MMNKAQGILAATLGSVVILAGSLVWGIGSNDLGYRQVIQSPSGEISVKFDQGWYWQGFDTVYTYPDNISYDTPDSVTTDSRGRQVQKEGITVQYQDGGIGFVDGSVMITLPNDKDNMVALHKAANSPSGLISKIISREVFQGLNLTAGLMTSEEAYAVRRNDYANWARMQVEQGRFQTVLKDKTVTLEDGKKQTKQVPTIKYDKDGITPLYQDGMFADYGLKVTGFQITSWDFEDKTKAQIDKKREAEMAIITAKANADRADWETKEVEAKGKKAIATVKYKELQIKEKATIAAEREKAVALTRAKQKVEVAKQLVAEQTQRAIAAKKEAEAFTTMSVAKAQDKKRMMQSDGALQQKLDAYKYSQRVWAEAFAKRAVPAIQMGQAQGGNGDASEFQSMLNAMMAKDLLVNVKATK